MQGGRAVQIQLLLRAFTSGWQHLGWKLRLWISRSFPVTSLWTLTVTDPGTLWRTRPYLSRSQTHNSRPWPFLTQPWELQGWWSRNAKHLEVSSDSSSWQTLLLSRTLLTHAESIMKELWVTEEGTCTPCPDYASGGLLCCSPINESISPTLIY